MMPRSTLADHFGFVEADDRLGQRVVVGVAARSDRADNMVRGEAFGIANRQVLDAAIGVVDESVEVDAFVES